MIVKREDSHCGEESGIRRRTCWRQGCSASVQQVRCHDGEISTASPDEFCRQSLGSRNVANNVPCLCDHVRARRPSTLDLSAFLVEKHFLQQTPRNVLTEPEKTPSPLSEKKYCLLPRMQCLALRYQKVSCALFRSVYDRQTQPLRCLSIADGFSCISSCLASHR